FLPQKQIPRRFTPRNDRRVDRLIGDNDGFSDIPLMPPMPAALAAHVPLAVATRGPAVESIHYGSVAVVDRSGRLLYSAGDPHALTFTRSALKPVQALPFVAAGGVEKFGYSNAQVALL